MEHNEECCRFYLNEDRRNDTKENFQLIYHYIEKYKSNWKRLCDVGCATGDFLWYVKTIADEQKMRNIELTGIDTYEELLRTAGERIPEGRFVKGDIYSMKGIDSAEKYDVVCMTGVLVMLDDFQTPIENLITITNRGGKVFVFSIFNENKCSLEVNYVIDQRERGKMVIASKQEVENWLRVKGYEYEFIPFKMKGKIQQRKDQPLRSFTVPLEDGTNGLMNGLGIWHDLQLLIIHV